MAASTVGVRGRPRIPPLAAIVVLVALSIAGVGALLPRAPAVTLTPTAGTTASVVTAAERRVLLEGGRLEISAVLATPAYFRATGQAALGARYRADRDVVILVAEDVHYGDMPAQRRPTLLLDGRPYAVSRVDPVVAAPHHRVSALVYADATALVDPRVSVAELRVDGATPVRWDRPFGGGAPSAAGLSIPLLLALFGGLLASMWPCLFQLTAYFLPTVAGLSLDEARSGRTRAPVVRTAVLFVSGIVVVYTAAGLVAGVAASSLSGSAVFEAARAPMSLAAGTVIIAMAARIALRARRPLACAMPVAAPGRSGTLRTIVLGLAFATGCMTCFGAAVVLGMFTYVVTTASPLVGGLVLFLFSLGIAVPLVIAAIAMARVLPLLARLERASTVMSLGSSTVMAAYGVLLITGSSHVVGDLVAGIAAVAR